MSEAHHSTLILTLLLGALLLFSGLLKSGLKRISVPNLIGYIVLGFFLRLADEQWSILGQQGERAFVLLATIGVFVLLFKIGLESDVRGLMKKIRLASLVWVFDFSLSGLVGFSVAHWVLGFTPVASIFAGVALSATSVGVSVGIWQAKGQLKSKVGEILVDVAELDDISGVLLMAIIFSLSAILRKGISVDILPQVLKSGARILGFVVIFGGFCFCFSRYVEKRLTRYYKSLGESPLPMLMVVGTGLIIAAFAGLLGLSIAIGAFFGGLAYSRDPKAVKMETSFESIHEFFVPFFFIGIGLKIGPEALLSGLSVGALMVLAALLGKFLGTFVPLFTLKGKAKSALLLFVSMVPRAEITLIVAQRALSMGSWAMPQRLFNGLVVVSATTCLASPIVLRGLLEHWPQKEDA